MKEFLDILLAAGILLALFVLGLCIFRNEKWGKTQLFSAAVLYIATVTLRTLALYEESLHVGDVMSSIYNGIKVFVLDFEIPEVVNPNMQGGWLTAAISAVAIAAGLLSLTALMSLLLKGVMSNLKARLLFKDGTKVFFGVSEGGFLLAEELKKEGGYTVFVADEEHKKEILSKGYLYCPEERAENADTFLARRPIKSKNTSLFFMAGEGAQNAAAAHRFLESLSKQVPDGASYALYVEAESVYRQAFEGRNTQQYSVRVFSFADLAVTAAAAHFFDTVAVNTAAAALEKPFTYIVSGNTPVGRSFFLRLAVLGQSAPHRVSGVFCDTASNISAAEGLLLSENPGLTQCMDVRFAGCTAQGPDFFALFKEYTDALSFVALCGENDAENLESARLIAQHYVRLGKPCPPILVYYQKDDAYGLSGLPKSLLMFGRQSIVYTKDIVMGGALDDAARCMHDYYEHRKMKDKKAKGVDYTPVLWENVNGFLRDSNRSAAEGFKLKLRLLGLESPEARARAFEDFETFLGGERLDTLTRTEHLRWNAFHYVNGWTTMPLDECLKRGVTKDALQKRHVCLVPFEGLVELEDALGEPYIRYDADNVTGIPDLCRDAEGLLRGLKDKPRDN